MIRYRPNEGRGTCVDTVTSRRLVERDEHDPYVDAVDAELPLAKPAVA